MLIVLKGGGGGGGVNTHVYVLQFLFISFSSTCPVWYFKCKVHISVQLGLMY